VSSRTADHELLGDSEVWLPTVWPFHPPTPASEDERRAE
jgi:hypothetical protein